MKYKVIPNFLPLNTYKWYYNYFFERKEMTYHYEDRIGSHNDTSGFYFTKEVYQYNSDIFDKSVFKLSTPLLYVGSILDPIRIKVNCFIKQPTHIKTDIHIDHAFQHQTLLYSINTNNGYTILDPKGENIKIPSIANQALIFDGLIEHQAVTQTDENVRINININYA